MGGEREWVLMTAICCGGLAVAGMNLPSFIVAVVVYSFCIAVLRMIAKADPQMSKVYQRYLKYGRYYPARSRPFRTE